MNRAEKDSVLIVDDMDSNHAILRKVFQGVYDVAEAAGGFEALSMLLHGVASDLVLLDVMMPEVGGLEVLKVMRNNPGTAGIPAIFITASGCTEHEMTALELGAADYITKPFIPEEVQLWVSSYLELAAYCQSLEREVEDKMARLTEAAPDMLERMAEIPEHRDSGAGSRVKRTQNLTERLMKQLLRTPRFANDLQLLDHRAIISESPLHDIGKIAMPDGIPLKPGRLTTEEYELMKRHTVIGGEMTDRIRSSCDESYYLHGKDICLYHHEHWDGTGYPHGLSGEVIPLPARIMLVIDVYGALVSECPYKRPFSQDDAVRVIREGAGTQFDPGIASLFCNMELGVPA